MRGTKHRCSGFAVSAIAFCKFYGIEAAESRRYPVELYDGMLVGDLNSPL